MNPSCPAPFGAGHSFAAKQQGRAEFFKIAEKWLTFPPIVLKYLRYGKTITEKKQSSCILARGDRCKPLCSRLRAASVVARENRDGRSRYRAAKMSGKPDN